MLHARARSLLGAGCVFRLWLPLRPQIYRSAANPHGLACSMKPAGEARSRCSPLSHARLGTAPAWSQFSPPRLLPPSKQSTEVAIGQADAMTISRVAPVGLRKQAIQRLRESQHCEIEQRIAYERARQTEMGDGSSITSHQYYAISSKMIKKSQGILTQLNQLHNFLNARLTPAPVVQSSTSRLRRSDIWNRQTASNLSRLTLSSSRKRDAIRSAAGAAEKAKMTDDAPQSMLQTMRRSTLMRFGVLVAHAEAARKDVSYVE